jgi:hypothetical protein
MPSGDAGLGVRPGTKAGEDRVGACDGGLEHCRVRSHQVDSAAAHLPGQFAPRLKAHASGGNDQGSRSSNALPLSGSKGTET